MADKGLRRRLSRAEDTSCPVAPNPIPASRVDEAGPLAAELARDFGRQLEHYKRHYSLTPEEARQKAGETPDAHQQHMLDCPPDEIHWRDISLIAQRDPDLALRRWEQVKEAARKEVRSGHRAAAALEGYFGSCWGRAQFLAVRAELLASVQPRSAVELQLIDQLAQWQALLWHWQETMAAYAGMVSETVRRRRRDKANAELPRQTAVEALDHAAAMVERFHRLYLRTLKALQEQRRGAPVLIRHARQVNVAQQQVNVTG